MEKKLTVLRYFAYSIEILLLFVIQGTPSLMPELFGGKPVLLIAAGLAIAAFEDETPSIVFGLACGVMCDLAISDSAGFFAVALTAACYAESLMFKTVIVRGFINSMIFDFCACVVIIGLYFLFFFIFKGYASPLTYFLNHYLSRIIYTFLSCIPVYFLNMLFYKKINAG